MPFVSFVSVFLLNHMRTRTDVGIPGLNLNTTAGHSVHKAFIDVPDQRPLVGRIETVKPGGDWRVRLDVLQVHVVPEGRILPAGIVAGTGELEEVLAAVLPVLGQVRYSLQNLDVVCHGLNGFHNKVRWNNITRKRPIIYFFFLTP